MTVWTSSELDKIEAADELEIAGLRQDGQAAKVKNHLGCPDW